MMRTRNWRRHVQSWQPLHPDPPRRRSRSRKQSPGYVRNSPSKGSACCARSTCRRRSSRNSAPTATRSKFASAGSRRRGWIRVIAEARSHRRCVRRRAVDASAQVVQLRAGRRCSVSSPLVRLAEDDCLASSQPQTPPADAREVALADLVWRLIGRPKLCHAASVRYGKAPPAAGQPIWARRDPRAQPRRTWSVRAVACADPRTQRRRRRRSRQ